MCINCAGHGADGHGEAESEVCKGTACSKQKARLTKRSHAVISVRNLSTCLPTFGRLPIFASHMQIKITQGFCLAGLD